MQIFIVDRQETLSEKTREFARRRLLFALSRFGSRIDTVRVVVEDVNGPRGGVDKACRVRVKFHRLPMLTVTVQDADLRCSLARAADRAGRAVARALDRNLQLGRRRPSLATDR